MDIAALARCVGSSYVSPTFGESKPEKRFLKWSVSSSMSLDRAGSGEVKIFGKRRLSFFRRPIMAIDESVSSRSFDCTGETQQINGKPKNIVWHNCPVTKSDREELIKQKGCVIWITGLSGSVTLASEQKIELKIFEELVKVAKLFDDAGIICIASLNLLTEERAACRALLPEGDFIEVYRKFMNLKSIINMKT